MSERGESGERMTRDLDGSSWDVVVVGGGAAGLSGALTLARARRAVLVLDAGEPRNAPAAGVHNLLSRDGTPPGELLAAGRAEVRRYGGAVAAARVADAVAADDGFALRLADGARLRARRLLVATGVVDELPDVPGLHDHWGGDVVHCPYCHGWEVADRPIGVLASGGHAIHMALLWSQWTAQLTLLTHDQPPPDGEDAARLAARRVAVVDGRVAAVEGRPGRLAGVRLADGRRLALGALAVATRLTPRLAGLERLGLRPVPLGDGLGARLTVDGAGRTDVPGVWAAGNVADPMAAVAGALDQGVRAGAAINMDLIDADARVGAAR